MLTVFSLLFIFQIFFHTFKVREIFFFLKRNKKDVFCKLLFVFLGYFSHTVYPAACSTVTSSRNQLLQVHTECFLCRNAHSVPQNKSLQTVAGAGFWGVEAHLQYWYYCRPEGDYKKMFSCNYFMYDTDCIGSGSLLYCFTPYKGQQWCGHQKKFISAQASLFRSDGMGGGVSPRAPTPCARHW